jgi:hypothetical protein
MAKKLKIKEFTDKQLTRIPKPGYWLSVYEFDKPIYGDIIWYTAYCIMNGHIRYLRTDHFKTNWFKENIEAGKNPWTTMLWTCMPTQKEVDAAGLNDTEKAKLSPEFRERLADKWFYFETLEDMKATFPDLDERFFVKPENDL